MQRTRSSIKRASGALRSQGYGFIALLLLTACGGATQMDADAGAVGGPSGVNGGTGIAMGGASSGGFVASVGGVPIEAGGATPAERGGTTAAGGTSQPSVGTGGAGDIFGTPGWGANHPQCPIQWALCAVALCGNACTDADVQLCYKSCGPDGIGFKSETCVNGTYVEQADCSFDPLANYSCFRLPVLADPACPTEAPQHGRACSVPHCIVCGGTVAGQTTGYLDSKSSQKLGYCVCLPATATSTQKWSCASPPSWPCPGNLGC